MSDGVFLIVSVILGAVVTALVEVTKLIAKTKLGQKLTSDVKLKAALISSFVIGTVAMLVAGELDLAGLFTTVANVFREPPTFWMLFPALANILKEVLMAVGAIQLVSQAVYAALKKKLKEVGWLAT